MPISANRPIEVREMPASASQKERVPKVSGSGRPLEKPMNSTASMRGSR